MRWRLAGLLFGLAAFAAACAGAAGDNVREVLVDHIDDEVASSYLRYFPMNVTVRPGDTVVFKQEWTGEAHSVTMGTMVDEMMAVVGPIVEEFDVEEPPADVLERFEAAMEPLPWMTDENFVVQQNAAQPCYLDEGRPPEDPGTPCADAQQVQPPFNGRQSYYNSGFIPYEGPQGNEFRVPLANDIAPGAYSYYCNFHGPWMRGTITVVEPGSDIPSRTEVAQQGRDEVEAVAQPLRDAFHRVDTRDVGQAEVEGRLITKPLAGYWDEQVVDAFVSEFIPEKVEVSVGEPLTWTFVGGHTVSFDVPEYFAQITVAEDGTVTFYRDAYVPVNSPGQPLQPPEGDGSAGPVVVDAGEWDGESFISSGVFYEHAYRLTFTRRGIYPYACMIHPQMVGEVVVR
jgi:plastocyanin